MPASSLSTALAEAQPKSLRGLTHCRRAPAAATAPAPAATGGACSATAGAAELPCRMERLRAQVSPDSRFRSPTCACSPGSICVAAVTCTGSFMRQTTSGVQNPYNSQAACRGGQPVLHRRGRCGATRGQLLNSFHVCRRPRCRRCREVNVHPHLSASRSSEMVARCNRRCCSNACTHRTLHNSTAVHAANSKAINAKQCTRRQNKPRRSRWPRQLRRTPATSPAGGGRAR